MDEICLRTAYPADAAGIARLDVETWQATYAGILGTPYLAGLSPARREAGWSSVIDRTPRDVHLALAGETIVGFGTCGASRSDPDFPGEIFTLYVAPDWQNQGIGRRLLLAMFAQLVDRGYNAAVIWVLRENASRFFYQRLGGREVRRKLLPFNGTQVPACGYGWADLRGYLSARTGAAESEG